MQYAMLANAPSGIVYVMNCAGYETEYHPYKFSSKMTAVSGMKTLFCHGIFEIAWANVGQT